MPPDKDTVTIIVASRLNWNTRKYEVAWFDDNETPHLIGSFDTIMEAELAATEYVMERMEAQLADMCTRAETLRLEIEAAKTINDRVPKTFMRPPRESS